MTRIEKLKYARRVLLTQDRIALRYQKIIRKELTTTAKALSDSYKTNHSDQGFNEIIKGHRDRLVVIVDKMSQETADAFKIFTLQSKKNTFESYIENAIYGQLIKNSMSTALAISNNTVAIASGVIAASMQASIKNPDKALPVNVADAISQRIGGVSANARAMTIARTETHKAANTAQYNRAEWAANDAGLDVEVEWISTNDGRVRDDHKHADGQKRDIGQPFNVGGEMLRYPSDPRGSAANVINCRCVLAYDTK